MAFLRQACASRAASTNFSAYGSGGGAAVGSVSGNNVGRRGLSSHWSSTALQSRVLAQEQRQQLLQESPLQRSKSSLATTSATANDQEDSQLLQHNSSPNQYQQRHFHNEEHQRQRRYSHDEQLVQQHWSQQRLWSLSPWTAPRTNSSQLLLKQLNATLLNPPTSHGYSTTATAEQSTTNAGADSSKAQTRPPQPNIPGNVKRDKLDVTFNNPIAAFKSKTTLELVRAYVVYMICSSEKLVEHNMAVSQFFSIAINFWGVMFMMTIKLSNQTN